MLTVIEFKQLFQFADPSSRRWQTALPLIAWSILIFALSSVPGNKYPQVSWSLADNAVHYFLYTILGLFAVICFRTRGFGWWTPILYGLSFGLSDEIHQIWVPMRSPSLSDWYADAAGITTSVIACVMLNVYFKYAYATQSESTSDSPETMELT